jgi:endonuclease/exonuclease/phosphatase family metal-dependent hydrolase
MTTRIRSTVERLLVRTWNLFHGNTLPPGRKAFLREMVRLASSDRPDVLCLQEIADKTRPPLAICHNRKVPAIANMKLAIHTPRNGESLSWRLKAMPV